MLSVQRAVWGGDIIECLLKADHIALDKGDTEVQHLVGGGRAFGNKTIRNTLTLLMHDEVTEDRIRRDGGEEGCQEKKLEVMEREHVEMYREQDERAG